MEYKSKVSIITPCYNSENTIGRTIESVLHQTFQDLEYIIIDGKSTDSTVQIIKEYDPLFNGRMRWISEPDSGIYQAMNKGIELCSAPLIGIINSDDWYEPDAVENAYSVYSQNPETIIYGLLRYFHLNGDIEVYQKRHFALGQEMIPHPTCFVPKKIYSEFGKYDTKYILSADYDLMLRYFTNNIQFTFIEKYLANFSSGGITTKNYQGVIENYQIRNKYGFLTYFQMEKNISKLILKSFMQQLGLYK